MYEGRKLPSNLPVIKRKTAIEDKLSPQYSSLKPGKKQFPDGIELSHRKSADHLVSALASKDYIKTMQQKIRWDSKMHKNFLTKIEGEQSSGAALKFECRDIAAARRSRNYLEALIQHGAAQEKSRALNEYMLDEEKKLRMSQSHQTIEVKRR